MADQKKCAHPGCDCVVTKGKYCSQRCENLKGSLELTCGCGHAECGGQKLR